MDERVEVFSSLSNPGPERWQPEAQAVHGISPEAIEAAPSTAEVDERAARWLRSHGGRSGTRSSVIAVGFNVGAFDFPFFRHYLPEAMSMVSRRSIDLNAICFMLAGWDPRSSDSARDWTGWRRSAKKHANKQLQNLGVPGATHDAGWDAAEALLAYSWPRDQVHQCRHDDPVASEPSDDPALASLGASLRARLQVLSDDDTRRLANAVAASELAPGKWFGTRRDEFGGRTALQAVQDGDFDLVYAHVVAATAGSPSAKEVGS